MDELELSFREAMARVSAPVTVITTWVDGAPSGTTVSAFASLSIAPPMVVFALDNRGGMIDRLRAAGRIGVNILAGDQAEIAQRFARRDLPDRFAGLAWQEDHGLPRFDGVAAWLRCEHLTFEPGGDHTLVLGTVTEASSADRPSLAYQMRQFRSL
ncbi:MAG: flavin reductase family protein [Tessaracoccus sp.]|uniref:flavin reductase family protein n=1 Tax=Tessaracoccus sp. TaxID=1971211 RepID=UPI001EB237A2|nr:flavin reductase family protein [Tessaracoccus sp.]MBK7819755.1 flavin reductase family protein [Tessaracoccus sp.]